MFFLLFIILQTLPRTMLRPLLLLVFLSGTVYSQTRTVSLGISMGLTSTYSWNQGIQQDPRYSSRYNVKWAPAMIQYGVDYEGFGFVLSPGVINIGQQHDVVNTVGGQKGLRKAKLTYLHAPVFLKIHIIDLSFFKVSFIAGGSIDFLLNGSENIEIDANTKLWFPDEVYPLFPPTYQIEYDGVIVPATNEALLTQNDFNKLQFFALTGLRGDWDVSENMRVSVDFQLNYGITEPRQSSYVNAVNQYQKLFELPGKQRDMFALISVGVARYLDVEPTKSTKKSPGKVFHKKNSRVRTSKPKG